MANILIDFSNISKEEIDNLAQGTKIFLSKNKDDSLLAFGEPKNLLTLTNYKKIEIIKSESTSLDITLELLKDENKKIDGIAAFRNYEEVKKSIPSNEIKNGFFTANYANAYSGKKTFIADLGFNPNPSLDDWKSYLSQLKPIVTSKFGVEDPTFKYLIADKLSIKKEDEEIINFFKEDDSYDGELTTNKFLEADADILLGRPDLIQATISGINQGITIYNNYIKKGIDSNIGYRIGGAMIRGVINSFNYSIDRKIVSGGIALIGYKKPLVLVDKNTTPNGLAACINFCKKIIEQ